LPDYGPFGRHGVHRDAVSLSQAWQYYRIRVNVSFMTGAVRSAILETTGLLVTKRLVNVSATCNVSVSSRTHNVSSHSRTLKSRVSSRSRPKSSHAHHWPLLLTVSCSSKSRLVLPSWFLPFWYLLTWVVPDKFQKSSKRLYVCVCVCVCVLLRL